MRFVDFLKTTVLLSAGAATALGALAVAGAAGSSDDRLVMFAAGWWALATIIGLLLGRRAQTNPPIARLLAAAKVTNSLPEPRPGSILLNRLWPLLTATLVAGAGTFVAPQTPAIGAGFAIIWALSWRRQEAAVAAIEERDGVEFHVQRTSPLRPMILLRTMGFRTIRPQQLNGAA